MLHIHYFASVREAMQRSGEELALPQGVVTVADLIALLTRTKPDFKAINQASGAVLVAVNQTVVGPSHPLADDDEVAFFPPMTGG